MVGWVALKSGSKLASDTITDTELNDFLVRFLSLEKPNHEPYTASEVSAELRCRGLRVDTQRIPHVVKESGVIKHKYLAAKTDYRLLVFWI